MIDPALQNIVNAMTAGGFVLPDPLTAEGLRALMDAPIPCPAVEVAEVRNLTFDGSGGEIAARLYHPRPGETLPLAVFLHGGGWVIGSLDTHDGLARILARDSGCALLSIDYRLAPEHPFPAPLDDCLSVVAALPARAEELGVDASCYAVVGDSAGGNLATAIALKLRGRADAPKAQVLFYPVTDNDFDTPSYRSGIETGTLSPEMMRFFWNAYIGDGNPDELAAPLRAADLTGMAPATLILAGNDPLYDEGVAYAVRLREAGVPTDLHDFSTAIHGFASLFGMAPIADEAVEIAARALSRALAVSS